jgi:hypothetical protein|tara:strand:- start:526 stop:795 length:270 start_codon:yes stop_codon:yes gene_type:complete
MKQPMTIKDLKRHLSFWEGQGTINDDTEVIIGKLGRDVNPVQPVCDTDIQVVREESLSISSYYDNNSQKRQPHISKMPNDKIAFTIVTE